MKNNTIQQSAHILLDENETLSQVLKKRRSNNNSAIKSTEASMTAEKTKEIEVTTSVLSIADEFDDVYAILNMNDTLTQAVTGTSDTDADSTTNNNNKTTIPTLQTTPTSVKTNMSTSSTPPPYTAPLIVFDLNGILVHKVWNNKLDK